ncbi:hypothetical protein PBY51_015486 [Eleginops maclovinus]|uniref:Uncharacterized protein n=1 Tax=Eleginops maclovinus TaxID=56733 RepID=A0AAN7X4Z3_ELEMC|nr:hypothetical protein PBY51_015486 [Eleginops maclovinus]
MHESPAAIRVTTDPAPRGQQDKNRLFSRTASGSLLLEEINTTTNSSSTLVHKEAIFGGHTTLRLTPEPSLL